MAPVDFPKSRAASKSARATPVQRAVAKELFAGSTAGLVFVTAFSSRDTMRSFISHISWETEVWIAEAPDHLIHFNGERFLGPYPDVMPSPPMSKKHSLSNSGL